MCSPIHDTHCVCIHYTHTHTKAYLQAVIVQRWKWRHLVDIYCTIDTSAIESKVQMLNQQAYKHWSKCSKNAYPNKRFTVLTDIHPFMHTFTHRRRSQPRRATASSSGATRVRRLAQGYHDTRLGGAGDRTSNLAVTSQPSSTVTMAWYCANSISK